MALANAVQGALRPSPLITWLDDTGAPVNLTGATITARIRNGRGESRAATGLFTVTDAAAGVFRWDLSAEDVEEAGVFHVQFTASYGSAPTPARTVVERWKVYDSIE